MGSAEAVGAAIAAFDALSLASRAALVVEVAEKEATLGSLLHLLSAKALTPQALQPVVAGLRAVGAGKAPPQESVAPLHAALSGLPTQTLTKVVALAADAGPLLEARPYMEAAQWAELVARQSSRSSSRRAARTIGSSSTRAGSLAR